VVSTLLGSPIPAPIRAAVDIAGGKVTDTELTQVTWWPGSNITTRHRVSVSGGSLDGRQSFVCVGGRIPDGAMIVEGEPGPVGVWRVPHDPALPGLASALDGAQASRLLSDLGGEEAVVTTSLRAYRPGRRAVVAVSGSRQGIYLKLVRPSRVEALHASHRWLASALPVPMSLGYAADQGLIALQSMPGMTLRDAMEDPASELPSPEEVVGIVHALPHPQTDRISPSPIDRMPELASLLNVVTPELSERVDRLVAAIGNERVEASTPCHGDYYESQLLVDQGRLAGLLDVDTYGWGRPGDDAATMLGHLAIWAGLSGHPDRVLGLGGRLIRIWDASLDPVDLRLRTAAVALSLATGPFRVQAAGWPGETADRVTIAERWLESATRA
jgi:aminoglycoside phosphotransferase